MSKQKFSTEERYAIWEEHQGKCFWKGELLDFNVTEIDHIVPESVASMPEPERTKLLATLCLPADYDVRGYQNLVPSCGPCNSQKSDRILEPAFIGHSLARTKSLTPRIQQSIATYFAGKTLAKVTHVIDSGLRALKFSPAELLAVLVKMGITPATLNKAADDAMELAAQSSLENPGRLPLSDLVEILRAIARGEVSGKTDTLADGTVMHSLRSRSTILNYCFVDGEMRLMSISAG